MDVSVIIINYNTKKLLINCISSIYEHTKDVNFEIIVSDNGSTDGSIELLKKQFPEVLVIENNENLGFGKANNVASKVAKGKYLFLLNSDTVLLNNAIKFFYDYAENCNQDCLLGSWLIDTNGNPMPSYGKFTTFRKQLLLYLYDLFPLFLRLRLFIVPRRKPDINESFQKVDFVTGADLFLPSEIFKKIQGFDENFFMYHEDDDLGRRALLLGYNSFLISGPQIIHLEGKSSKNTTKKIMIREKSFFIYLQKYESKKVFHRHIKIYRLFITIRLFALSLSIQDKIGLSKYTKELLKGFSK